MTCEYCGHPHARDALCARRPTWGRRGFLALLGATVLGAGLPVVTDLTVDAAGRFRPTRQVNDRIVGVYLGNGAMQTAFNVGFSPQIVLIRPRDLP